MNTTLNTFPILEKLLSDGNIAGTGDPSSRETVKTISSDKNEKPPGLVTLIEKEPPVTAFKAQTGGVPGETTILGELDEARHTATRSGSMTENAIDDDWVRAVNTKLYAPGGNIVERGSN